MKILVLLLVTTLLFGGFMIISNNNLYLSKPKDISNFIYQYKTWLTNALETGKTFTGQIINNFRS